MMAEPERSGLDLSQLLAALGAGIGVLGFVTFAGGAVIWGRLDQAGLPADEVVGVVPRETLIVTGASVLVPAVVIALLTVLILLAVDQVTALWTRLRERKLKEALAVTRKSAADANHAAASAAEIASAFAKALESVKAPIETIRSGSQDVELPSVNELEAKAQTEADKAVRAAQEAALRRAQVAEKEAVRQRELVMHEQSTFVRWLSFQERGRRIVVIAVLVVLQFVLAFLSLPKLGPGPTALLVLLAMATSFACSLVLLNTRSFAWFGVAAFVAAGLFAAASSYAGVRKAGTFAPVAVIKKGEIPMYGLFIAQSKDRLLLADPLAERRAMRVLSVPTSDVLEVSVGSLAKQDDAATQAFVAAQAICARRAKTAAAPRSGPSAQSPRPCSSTGLPRPPGTGPGGE